MTEDEKGIRKLYRRLKKELPTKWPVVLKFVDPDKIKGSYGEMWEYDKYYLIVIAVADYHVMLSTLIHEYAHCVHRTKGEDHCDEWGRAYAQCYRVYLVHEEGVKKKT